MDLDRGKGDAPMANARWTAPARRMWRSLAPEGLRDRVTAARKRRHDAAWRKPRDLGDLRTTVPFSTWGSSRGGPIDRVYIGQFLERHSADIRGRALEIAGDEYIRAYGRGVVRTDILDVFPENPRATIVGDIADAPVLPDAAFDCVLVTQVLPFLYEPRQAFRTAHRILVPGGVLLATTPGLCRIAPVEDEQFGHWWNFTARSARRVAEEAFGEGNVEVETFGNVLSAAAFLFGLGPWDITPEQLAVHDPAFEVTIGIRAVKRD
jgi:SAM-dependent methyltransferase